MQPIPRPEPLRASVYRQVVDLLTSGELPPGRAVSEAALSKALGVSRTPVREALLQLEADGAVRSSPARGFRVCELSHGEAAELYPILATLEGLAVRTATGEPDLAALAALDRELAGTTDPARRWRVDTAFHAAVAAGCGNASLLGLIDRLRVVLCRYELAPGSDRGHTAGDGHADLLAALANGDRDRAAVAIDRAWRDSLSAVQRRLGSATDG